MFNQEIPPMFCSIISGNLIHDPVFIQVNGSRATADRKELRSGESYEEAPQVRKALDIWKEKNPHVTTSPIIKPEIKQAIKKPDDTFRYLVTGSRGVGQTQLINVLKGENFSSQYQATLHPEEVTHSIEIQGKLIELKIMKGLDLNVRPGSIHEWRYKRVFQEFQVALFLFEVNSSKSFEEIQGLIVEAKNMGLSDSCIIILVGTKIDLENQRIVTSRRATNVAEQLGIKYVEVSAKENKNITTLFSNPAVTLITQKQEEEEACAKKSMAESLAVNGVMPAVRVKKQQQRDCAAPLQCSLM